MTTTAALEAVKKIEVAPHDETLRICRRIEIGHAIQQGDIYIHRVADDHPRGKQIGVDAVQVALGTGNGARHIAEGAVTVYEGIELPSWVTPPGGIDAKEMCGPVIVATEPWLNSHPEHPHHKMPAGTYQVTYQIDMKTMRRVVD